MVATPRGAPVEMKGKGLVNTWLMDYSEASPLSFPPTPKAKGVRFMPTPLDDEVLQGLDDEDETEEPEEPGTSMRTGLLMEILKTPNLQRSVSSKTINTEGTTPQSHQEESR